MHIIYHISHLTHLSGPVNNIFEGCLLSQYCGDLVLCVSFSLLVCRQSYAPIGSISLNKSGASFPWFICLNEPTISIRNCISFHDIYRRKRKNRFGIGTHVFVFVTWFEKNLKEKSVTLNFFYRKPNAWKDIMILWFTWLYEPPTNKRLKYSVVLGFKIDLCKRFWNDMRQDL